CKGKRESLERHGGFASSPRVRAVSGRHHPTVSNERQEKSEAEGVARIDECLLVESAALFGNIESIRMPLLKITDASGRQTEHGLEPKLTCNIGRAPDNQIVLDDPRASRHHAHIRPAD